MSAPRPKRPLQASTATLESAPMASHHEEPPRSPSPSTPRSTPRPGRARRRAAARAQARRPGTAQPRARGRQLRRRAARAGAAHGPADARRARHRARRDTGRPDEPACSSTGSMPTARSPRSSIRGSSGQATSTRRWRRAASACPACWSRSTARSTSASARRTSAARHPGRGDWPRGARDPARDGPPGRRADPRPHVPGPAQGSHAHAARDRSRAARGVRLTPSLRTVYLGTSPFAAAVLERLAATPHRPAGDHAARPAEGRGRALASPAVADAARALGLELIQPEQLHAPEVLARIAAAAPDALVLCAFGVLVSEPLLSEYEIFNVHPSLLPRWRGAAPIERAIMAGDAETGVSIMRLTEGLDAGPVCAARRGADPARRRLRDACRAPPGCRRRPAGASARRAPALDRPGRRGSHVRAQDRGRGPRARPDPHAGGGRTDRARAAPAHRRAPAAARRRLPRRDRRPPPPAGPRWPPPAAACGRTGTGCCSIAAAARSR